MDFYDSSEYNNCFDIFDPPECNFGLQDSLNNDWLENIFSSPTSGQLPLPPQFLTDQSPSDACQSYDHGYSSSNGGSSPPSVESVEDNWSHGNDMDVIDVMTSADGLTVTSPSADHDDLLWGGWIEDDASSSSCSVYSYSATRPYPSTPPRVADTAAEERTPPIRMKKNFVLVTDEEGRTMKFTEERRDEQFILVDDNSSTINRSSSSSSGGTIDYKQELYDETNADVLDLRPCHRRLNLIPSEDKNKCFSREQQSPIINSTPTQENYNIRSYTLTEALFSNPVPSTGLLHLTDEEKKTLIGEGYPVPLKLPLGKNEEKYLKKIRRKIKNKISAQESRRKKKEYTDQLEIKMHRFCQENSELLKKVDSLETNNRMLLAQLHNVRVTGTTPGGTTLMVLVLFFAVFIGTWSPISWSIGYRGIAPDPTPNDANDQTVLPKAVPLPSGPFVGPDLQQPFIQVYSAGKVRSRLLMSTKEESLRDDEAFGPVVPISYKQVLMSWWSYGGVARKGEEEDVVKYYTSPIPAQPVLPRVQLPCSSVKASTTYSTENYNATWRLAAVQPKPPFAFVDGSSQATVIV